MVVCELMISYWIRTQAQWISYLWPKFLLNLACSWYNQYYFTGKSQLQELQNHKARLQKYFKVRLTHAYHCKNPESNKAALFSICTDNTEFLIYKQSKEIDECLTKLIRCNPSSLDSIVCPIQHLQEFTEKNLQRYCARLEHSLATEKLTMMIMGEELRVFKVKGICNHVTGCSWQSFELMSSFSTILLCSWRRKCRECWRIVQRIPHIYI